jgi:uncharacterized membrane protein
MPSYAAFKIIHLLGVALFLGNIIVTGVWKYYADRTKCPRVIGFAQRLVTLTDWAFTLGGVILILIGGYGMARLAGYDLLERSWLLLGQGVFIASGVIWCVVLIPIQVWQARLARRFENGGAIPDVYWRLSRHWLVWGAVAILIPLANLYVMIVKP